jgi:hypothetical protein
MVWLSLAYLRINYNLTFENNNVIKLMYVFVPIFMVNEIF